MNQFPMFNALHRSQQTGRRNAPQSEWHLRNDKARSSINPQHEDHGPKSHNPNICRDKSEIARQDPAICGLRQVAKHLTDHCRRTRSPHPTPKYHCTHLHRGRNAYAE